MKLIAINFIVILCLFSPIATDVISLNGLSRPTYNKTIYVDDVPGSGPDNPPEDYTSIQDAVNFTSPLCIS